MPAGISKSMRVTGGGAVPSVVARWKPKTMFVGVPSRLGLNDALNVAVSVAPAGRQGALTHTGSPAYAVTGNAKQPRRIASAAVIFGVGTVRAGWDSVAHSAVDMDRDGVV